MVILRAKGTKDGRDVSVVCKCQDGKKPAFLFNGKKDEFYEYLISFDLKERHLTCGTYCPKKDDAQNVYNVLKNYFFDSEVKVKVDGEMPKLPYKKGVIY